MTSTSGSSRQILHSIFNIVHFLTESLLGLDVFCASSLIGSSMKISGHNDEIRTFPH
jgi:hypothetical protein